MKRIGVVVTSIALAMAPALAADKTIPLATMTCKQFVDSPKDTIGVILTWMMGNVTAHEDADENIFPRKEPGREENKIDGAVATIMAISRAMYTESGLRYMGGFA